MQRKGVLTLATRAWALRTWRSVSQPDTKGQMSSDRTALRGREEAGSQGQKAGERGLGEGNGALRLSGAVFV